MSAAYYIVQAAVHGLRGEVLVNSQGFRGFESLSLRQPGPDQREPHLPAPKAHTLRGIVKKAGPGSNLSETLILSKGAS